MSSRYTARILGATLLFLLVLSTVSAAQINYTSSDTFTVPAGVTRITVELWGAGGGSGAGDKDGPTNLGAGGGAGGQYAQSNLTVSAGQNFTITVAAASGAATAGGDTTLSNGSGNLVVAKGGAAGTDAVAPSAGTGGLGGTASGIGDIVYAGGNGADGIVGGNGGGGGGGAGSSGAGGDASGATAGTGTANNVGGDGGAGASGAGNAGNLAGGGGGGGSGNNQAGAGGAAGYARITYEAPPDAPTGVSATDGSQTDRVTVSWTKSSGATGYYVYTQEDGLIASLGDVATYDHTSAPAGSITAGSASATNGTSRDNVTLSLAGESTSNGATRTYYVVAENSAGNSSNSATDTGYRGVGSLTYQWQRSAADSDASYNNIGGATTDPYTDTGAPQTGEGRYYRAVLNAAGAAQQISSTDRGFVNVTPYASNFDGATTNFAIEGDLSAVSQPILEASSFGRIQWYGTVDARDADFDTYVSITDNSIDVDSANLDTSLNSRAEIRFYGLPYATEPVIFKDGNSCGPPECNVTSYAGGTLIADVSGFSEYTTADFTATPNQSWTVTAWVNIDDTGGTQYLVDGINLGLYLVNSTSDRMLMRLNSGANEWNAYTSPGLLAGQGWKHVAFVFRADDDYRRIYVNGVNETILGPNLNNETLGFSSEFEIGKNASGIIDEVMIFNRSLAESEIDAIYRAGLYPYRVNLTNLAEGNYTFVAYSVDEAGNYQNTSMRTITVSTSLDCQTISSSGTYTLTQDVSSAGTCFNITASNAALDCAGYAINYSQSVSGYGIYVSPGITNVSVTGCDVHQADSTGSSGDRRYGVFIDGDAGSSNYVTNSTVSSTNVTTYGAYADAFYAEYLRASNLSDIVITTSGDQARGIDLVQSTNNTFVGVSSTTSGTAAYAFIVSSGSVSNYLYNSSLSASTSDIYLNMNAGSGVYAINTTYADVSFQASDDGSVYRGWYVDLYVNDTGGSPLSANVLFADSGSYSSTNPNASGNVTTSGTGYYRDLVLYEYTENFTDRYYHTNYTFNVSNSSYVTLTDKSHNFSTNTQLTFTMTEILDCQTISSPGTYTMNSDVSSAGTCFTINVSDVTLDCAGYTINYSQSAAGNGIRVNTTIHNFSIESCVIEQGSAQTVSPGVFVFPTSQVEAENWSIANTTIETFGGADSFGVEVQYASSFNVTDTTIRTLGSETTLYGKATKSARYVNVTLNSSKSAVEFSTNANNSRFINSTLINGVGDSSIYHNLNDASGNTYVINSEINRSDITFPASDSGTINFGWYVDFYVNDTNGNPVSATINYTDSGAGSTLNPSSSNTSLSTDGTGFLKNLVLYEQSRNFTDRYDHTNYTFDVSNSSYFPLVDASRNFSSNTQLNFTLSNEPIVENVTISSSSGTNTTLENLSVTYDVASVGSSYNTTDWRVNGTSIAVVNMPFDINVSSTTIGAVQSFSTYSSDGQLGYGVAAQAPVWSTNGYSGGAYEFDGVNDTLHAEYSMIQDTFTIMAWVKTSETHEIDTESTSGTDGISGQNWFVYPEHGGSSGAGAGVSVGTNGVSVYEHGDAYLPAIAVYSGTIGSGWNHIAVVYEEKQPKIYVNGSLVRTGLTSPKSFVNSSQNLGGTSYGWLNGSTDSFKVFDRALSAAQINSVYTTESSGAWTEIVSDETVKGENWSVAVTTSDLEQYSATVLSENLTILDGGAPTWRDNATNETAETPRYNEYITMNVTLEDDSDLDAYVFSWNDSGSWVNDSSVDISGTQHNVSISKQVARTKGDVIAWRVYFNDSAGNTNVTDVFEFTVKNTAPPVPVLDYPADNESFLTNRTPRYNWTVGADVDGDPVTYRWYLALDESFSSMAGSNTSVQNEYYDQQSPLDFTTYWWRVSACDAEDCSDNSTTFNFTVTSLISIELSNATPDFGNLSLGDQNDTTNGVPPPLTVRNVGNIEANITMNASALWNAAALDTDYYQAKARQSEIGAYTAANTTYFNLSTVLKRIITNLGWEDAADEALIDLRVEAPLDEYPGTKNSTIRVVAS